MNPFNLSSVNISELDDTHPKKYNDYFSGMNLFLNGIESTIIPIDTHQLGVNCVYDGDIDNNSHGFNSDAGIEFAGNDDAGS